MYKIQNIIKKMHLKNYMAALMINEDIKLEGYLWKFNALNSQLVMIGMPMVKEYLVETLLNVLLDLYESFIQAIVGTGLTLSFETFVGRFLHHNIQSLKDALFTHYKKSML